MSANFFQSDSSYNLDLPKIKNNLPRMRWSEIKDQGGELLFDDNDIVDLADRIDGFFNSVG